MVGRSEQRGYNGGVALVGWWGGVEIVSAQPRASCKGKYDEYDQLIGHVFASSRASGG